MHGGQRYVRSCRQLGVPPTKEASYRAANDWWRAKLAEIGGTEPPHPHADFLTELERRKAWAQRHGAERDAVELRKRLDTVSH